MAVREVLYQGYNFSISYEILNLSSTKGDIVFLHGWGSSKEVMKQAFKDALTDYRHIYVDLPGFGASRNEMVLKSSQYAEIIQLFLDSIGVDHSAILVGHSFGGKIAVLLKPTRIVLLSSAGIVPTKSLSVRLKIMVSKFFRRLGISFFSNLFRSSDVKAMPPHMYETFKLVVNEDFSEIFKCSPSNALVLWGEQDYTTPISSGYKIAEYMPHSSFQAFKGDHFFFLQQKKAVHAEILNWICCLPSSSVAQVEQEVILHKQNWRFCCKGKVQGVGFRKYAAQISQEFEIGGWVMNENDGSVVGEIYAKQEDMEKFINRLKEGNGRLVIQECDIQESSFSPFSSFEIRYKSLKG
ncbi:hypothetical protein CCZ01_05150 [Helicobacter monodelphidis]|uniref:alpha/beta fold hydrolase n=1 Tax=Helicobacter sp. 15-1451 TaxID=2004995 RepID=UPI000DCC33BF|nr:alpha/beta fold hydrolase [Helicobacter sp. 15-1451]RAX57676.1 hypothetical protein CCZ01_05150 [Helicobacter sp. 15-1451]